MQPTMIAKAEPLGLARHRQRLGQAAGLVELDVDRVIAADQRGEAGAVVHAFVGADRDRPRDRRERRVGAGGQRLLDQRDAGGGAGREVGREIVRASSPRWRRRSAPHCGAAARTAAMRSGSPGAAELDLEQLARRRRLRAASAIVSGVPSEIV